MQPLIILLIWYKEHQNYHQQLQLQEDTLKYQLKNYHQQLHRPNKIKLLFALILYIWSSSKSDSKEIDIVTPRSAKIGYHASVYLYIYLNRGSI